MNEWNLNEKWAWSQIEAYVHGTLRGSARWRMRAAVDRSPELAAEVERAAAVQRALANAPLPRMPGQLRSRLLGIPGPMRHWHWAALPAAAAAAMSLAIGVALLPGPQESQPDPRTAAVRDFEVAMMYLQKSLERSNQELKTALGGAFHDALMTSRASFEERTFRDQDGR